MMLQRRIAAEAVSVGEVLRDHILGLPGITQDKLAAALGVSRHSVNELLNARRSITAEMALRLARALGTSPEFWMDLQRDADLYKALQKIGSELESIPILRTTQTQIDVVVPLEELFGHADDIARIEDSCD